MYLMYLDLDFLFLGLLGFRQIDGQNALVKGRINLVRFNKRRQLDLPFKSTMVTFDKEPVLILLFLFYPLLTPEGENIFGQGELDILCLQTRVT